MNPNETLTITDYISQLFPDMTYPEVEEAATVYEGYGTALEQAIMAIADCESYADAVLATATLTGTRSHLCVPDVLSAPDIYRSCMEDLSVESLSASPGFDASFSGSLCRPARIPWSGRTLLLS